MTLRNTPTLTIANFVEILIVDPKFERAALLNKERVQRHRDNKKQKLDTTISSSQNQQTSKSQNEAKLEVSDPASIGSEAEGIENHKDETSHNSDLRLINSVVQDSEDSEFVTVVLPDESSNKNITVAQMSFKDKIKIWASRDVAYTKVDELLRILNEQHSEIPKCAKTLLKCDLQLSHKIRKFNILNPSDTSEFVYFGIACYLIKVVNVALHPDRVLKLKFNVDGMSPFSSSPMNFWPILGLVHHEFASYKPFVIAAYYGIGKPFSVDLYLHEFIIELNDLCQDGIVINEVKFVVTIKCFCCDRPARAFLKCIVNHGAYYACERCWVKGFQYLNRMVYPLRDCRPRTDQSFRSRENPYHHESVSPLLKLRDSNGKPVDMIKLFMQDFMHAGPLGIMKKLMLEQWFSDDSKMTRKMKMVGSLRLVNLADQVPIELQRICQDLNKLCLWEAKDFRLFLVYVGPLVLNGVLPEDQYKHFLLLYTACRIMHSKYLLNKFGEYTKMFLDRFVLLCEVIYGLDFVVLNPHLLSHLYEDVVNMQCSITYLDAFIFKGYLFELKKSLRSGNRPLAQLCHKIETDLELNQKKVVSTSNLLILKHFQKDDFYHVSKLRYLGFELTIKKPDNVVLMKSGCFIEIKDIMCSSLEADSSKLYILGQKLQIVGSAFNYPVPSSALNIFEVKRVDGCDSIKFPLNELSSKMAFLVVELCAIENEPAWDEPLVVVPIQFMPPTVKDLVSGTLYIYYPSMPHTFETKELIKDFVEKKITPPDTWGAKKCVLKNVALTQELALKFLAAIKASKSKASKKRRVMKNKEDNNLPSICSTVKKIKQTKKSNAPTTMAAVVSNPTIEIPRNDFQIPPTTMAAVVSNPTIEIPRNDFQILFDVTNSEIAAGDEMYATPSENFSANQMNSEPIDEDATDNFSNAEMKEHLFEMPKELTSENSLIPFVEDTASDISNEVIFTKDSDVQNTDMSFGLEESSLGSHNLGDQTTNAGQNVGPYILLTQQQLSDIENRLANRIGSEVSIIIQNTVKKIVDKTVSPRFDSLDSAVLEMQAIAKDKSQNQDILTFEDFKKLYNDFNLPLATYEEFQSFDAAVIGINTKDDKDKTTYKNFCADLTKHMRNTSNCGSKSEDNCKAIARRFMKKELICSFTATKPSGTKPVFKATGFFQCILDALTYVHTKDGKSSVDEHILGFYVGNLINSIRTSLGRAATAVSAPRTADGQPDDS
ncbi:hypothetical protein QAD02_018856 [Eretmocerus hayati]|uniref:Uncharacterized protein n=1 Tax=Eretmocerus hayati TaxID=131215 RepID=A0ACC2PHJ4_9HYME|nr:hypothetical protein QAD02_018856 [Eretmocerus hayati]